MGEGLIGGVDEVEDEAFGLVGVLGEATVDGDQVRVGAGGEGGLHFGGGEAVAGDGAFEEFDGDGLVLVPEGAVDGTGGAFAELSLEFEGVPGDVGEGGGEGGGGEGIAGEGEPGEAGEVEEPVGEGGEVVGGDA